jgi:uncharacterized coiled-coil DUF342 family protein
MSCCATRRQELQARVKRLEERLREQARDESSETVGRLREELKQAVAELVTVGNCGD